MVCFSVAAAYKP